MKGTLLLLALLVTGELGFQTTEACALFFETFISMAVGNKLMMNAQLSKLDPTPQEREAMEKIQECYNNAGLKAKFADFKVMETIAFSAECKKYYKEDVLDKIKNLFPKLL
ncbi:hypothetical protein A6R68_13623 [Neotoma lepida]|uniref:Androgen-binding protein homolog n=1 Tax=Neotoma lepida TaxID=56216 RepID=A0A1A6H1V8_NEOLE|nr:hypothetical protein A6R68_13623 [Neotoma lepida]